jgi:hypothetical protein
VPKAERNSGASQAAEKLGLIRLSGSAALQRRVQVRYFFHPEPASAGEGSAFRVFQRPVQPLRVRNVDAMVLPGTFHYANKHAKFLSG